jgi:hypothetical protein
VARDFATVRLGGGPILVLKNARQAQVHGDSL